jgi:hypothetical protein
MRYTPAVIADLTTAISIFDWPWHTCVAYRAYSDEYHLRVRNWSFENLNYTGNLQRKCNAGCVKVVSYKEVTASSCVQFMACLIVQMLLLWIDTKLSEENTASIFRVGMSSVRMWQVARQLHETGHNLILEEFQAAASDLKVLQTVLTGCAVHRASCLALSPG